LRFEMSFYPYVLKVWIERKKWIWFCKLIALLENRLHVVIYYIMSIMMLGIFCFWCYAIMSSGRLTLQLSFMCIWITL
jgi:hypothetical protein